MVSKLLCPLHNVLTVEVLKRKKKKKKNLDVSGDTDDFCDIQMGYHTVAFFTKEVNPRLAKRPSKTNGRLGNCEFTSLVKEATGI